MLTQERERRRARTGSDPEFARLNHTIRWLWRCMHLARAAKQRLGGRDAIIDDWARGYSSGMATATKIILRDILRTRRALRERAGEKT